jgi:hypothetical protein
MQQHGPRGIRKLRIRGVDGVDQVPAVALANRAPRAPTENAALPELPRRGGARDIHRISLDSDLEAPIATREPHLKRPHRGTLVD